MPGLGQGAGIAPAGIAGAAEAQHRLAVRLLDEVSSRTRLSQPIRSIRASSGSGGIIRPSSIKFEELEIRQKSRQPVPRSTRASPSPGRNRTRAAVLDAAIPTWK